MMSTTLIEEVVLDNTGNDEKLPGQATEEDFLNECG